jgi:hypothetical protein
MEQQEELQGNVRVDCEGPRVLQHVARLVYIAASVTTSMFDQEIRDGSVCAGLPNFVRRRYLPLFDE